MESSSEVPVVVTEKKESSPEFDEKACEELFQQGKRNLLCGEFSKAVNQLQEVCSQLAAKYGETAPDCADAYFHYGCALLELGRMESRVLGNALQGMTEEEETEGKDKEEDSFAVPSTITDEEKEKISEEVLDAMMERDPSLPVEQAAGEPMTVSDSSAVGETSAPSDKGDAGTSAAEVEEAKGEKDESSDSKDETESSGTTSDDEGQEAEGEVETEPDAVQNENGSQTEDDDDVSNLQLAWEMLELAKNTYRKQETKEARLKESECLKKLGEVGLESEQYSQSIEDFCSCLKLLADAVDDPKTDRRLAEAQYQIGVACVNANRYDDGVVHFRDAITILQAKMAVLQATVAELSAVEAEKTESTDNQLASARNELKEITDLIPEIQLKIEDANEEKTSVHLKDVIKTTTGFGDESGTTSMVCDTKQVDDVTHLVRKKRKPEDDVVVEETKKPKTGEHNGVAVCNEVKNGEAKSNGTVAHADIKENEVMDTAELTNGIKVKTVEDCVNGNAEVTEAVTTAE